MIRTKCANGCDAPVQPPSKVICKNCLDKIGEKMREIARRMRERSEKESTP